MINIAPKYLWSILLLGFWAPPGQAECCDNEPVSALSLSEFNQMQSYFHQLLDGTTPPPVKYWKTLGLNLTEDDDYYYLMADEEKKFGLGKTVVRKRPESTDEPIMIQVPHQFYDRHTGDIGRALFEQGKFRVYIENTVQRFNSEQADLTRLKRSIFSAFAAAFTQRFNGGKVIQIHGFSSEKRKTDAGRFADIIVSNGTVNPDRNQLAIKACLQRQLKLVTRVFGLDVFELGATANPTGNLLNDVTVGQFIHIEMSEKIRQNHANLPWLGEMTQCL